MSRVVSGASKVSRATDTVNSVLGAMLVTARFLPSLLTEFVVAWCLLFSLAQSVGEHSQFGSVGEHSQFGEHSQIGSVEEHSQFGSVGEHSQSLAGGSL